MWNQAFCCLFSLSGNVMLGDLFSASNGGNIRQCSLPCSSNHHPAASCWLWGMPLTCVFAGYELDRWWHNDFIVVVLLVGSNDAVVWTIWAEWIFITICQSSGSFSIELGLQEVTRVRKGIFMGCKLACLWWQPKDLLEFIQLVNQLINKFKSSLRDILQDIFPAIVGRVFALLPQNVFPEGPGSQTEVSRPAEFPAQTWVGTKWMQPFCFPEESWRLIFSFGFAHMCFLV